MMNELTIYQTPLELLVFVTVTLFTLTYSLVFYFLQRREHHGSLKETGSSRPFASPHPTRKVTIYYNDHLQVLVQYAG